jgi:NAD(P)-dependent dehydrogenase (short-subunit alcohol dehydrogenase family)
VRLRNKVAVVSGAAHGMGAEEARLFAREGAKVVIADILEAEGRKVESEIRAAGGEALFVRTDVTSEAEWRHAVQSAVSRFGKLDVLVNNAGISGTSVPDPLDSEGWHRIMAINATGVYYGCKHVIPVMRAAKSGAIVNISSIMGFVGDEGGHPAYHASKAAVRILSKALAVKYGPDGIRVNSVHPGYMPPMLTTARDHSPFRDEQVRRLPLGRLGQPIEVANGVLFLASDEASYITGTELVIDGGFLAR